MAKKGLGKGLGAIFGEDVIKESEDCRAMGKRTFCQNEAERIFVNIAGIGYQDVFRPLDIVGLLYIHSYKVSHFRFKCKTKEERFKINKSFLRFLLR